MKKVIRLTESDLHRIVNNSVKKMLRESSMITRGTNTSTINYPVPYDDNYIDKYGPTHPSETYTEENSEAEKYIIGIQQRIEHAMETLGLSCDIDAHQDNDTNYYEENESETNYSTITFDIKLFGDMIQCSKSIYLLVKLFQNLSMVKTFEVDTNMSSLYMWGMNISIKAYVKPDKNGRETIGGRFSKYKPSEED